MKSIKIFAAAGAIALLGMAGLSSCKTNNGPEGPGKYNGETVKTQFAISIPEVNKPNVAGAPDVYRMPATNTQDATSDFLGMDNIVLMPFTTTESGTPKVSADVTNTSTMLTGVTSIHLSNVGGAGVGNISPTGLAGTANYKVYSDVTLPTSTNHFLFYAHGTTPSSDGLTSAQIAENDFKYGTLIVDGMDATAPGTIPTSGAISFSHKQIYTSGDTKGAAIATYLTNIATAKWTDDKGNSDPTDDEDHPWSSHGNTSVKALYDAFITMQAGSSNSVLATVEDLYNSLMLYNEAYKPGNGGNDDPVVAAVLTKILVETEADAGMATPNPVGAKVLTWKANSACSGYPQNINLPDGSAAIAWGTPNAGQFNVANTYAWAAANNGAVSLDVAICTDYVYPSCIYYYVNSGLRTSTSSQVANYGSKTWASILSDLYSTNISVDAATRSVAIEKPIQYGVARLKTSVKAYGATIKDFANANIDVTNLQMTAVLVGGQGPVGYNFSPVTDLSDADYYKKIVYDPYMTAGNYSLNSDHVTYTEANPTLVLESKKNKKVLMAVEFINNGVDFLGASGKIIPHGTKFYVVAELDPTSSSTSKTDPASTDGNPDNCVFKQDHTTFVKLTLKDLSHAYNLVPDLRTSGLEIGFSVDLTWQTGYTFTIEI